MWRIVRIDKTPFGQKLGRRGLVLIFAGLAWVMIGINIVQLPDVPRFASESGPRDSQILLHMLDNCKMGYFWVACGISALVVGLLHHKDVLRRHDSIGFNFILLPPITWMLGFLYSGGTAVFTGGELGRYEAFYGAIVWFTLCLFIIVIAGWPEASPAVRADLDRGARRRLGLRPKRLPRKR